MTTGTRAEVRNLADRMSREYAGLLPPGQVLALVFRAERSLVALGELSRPVRVEVCEDVVRRMIAQRMERGPWSVTA